jgi:integrase
MNKLTEANLRNWQKEGKPLAGKSDGGGLTFTLSRAGTASWTFRYRFGGKQREMTLGSYPDMNLQTARTVARSARVMVDQGKDVAAEKRKDRLRSVNAKSFRHIAEEYLARAERDLAQRTHREVKRYLRKDIFPRLGPIDAQDIEAQDIVVTIERIAQRSDSVARHAFEILSVIFAHALARSDVKQNPCTGLKLAAILGPRPPRRERLKLSREELRQLLSVLPIVGRENALMIKIELATCVRKGELIRARKEFVDLNKGTWFVPDQHSKGGKGFVVPLVPVVVDWFRQLYSYSGDSDWLLPARIGRGRYEGKHMSDKTLNAALKRHEHIRVRNFTEHDLRSTARSHLAALGTDVIHAERCLNHRLGGLVGIYDQHDYLDERRKALELWTNLLVEIETGEPQNIVPFRVAA